MSVVDDITALLGRKAAALVARSAADLDAIIDPAFIYVNARGNKFGKEEYISLYCRSGAMGFVRQDIGNIEIIDLGAVAVASVTIEDEIESHGTRSTGRYRSLCVLRKNESGWRWIAGQTSPLADGA